VILWITSDHIAWLWATGIAIDVGYGDAIQVVTMIVGPHLSDLFSTVLFVHGHSPGTVRHAAKTSFWRARAESTRKIFAVF
jgi:hypothetical protein